MYELIAIGWLVAFGLIAKSTSSITYKSLYYAWYLYLPVLLIPSDSAWMPATQAIICSYLYMWLLFTGDHHKHWQSNIVLTMAIWHSACTIDYWLVTSMVFDVYYEGLQALIALQLIGGMCELFRVYRLHRGMVGRDGGGNSSSRTVDVFDKGVVE